MEKKPKLSDAVSSLIGGMIAQFLRGFLLAAGFLSALKLFN